MNRADDRSRDRHGRASLDNRPEELSREILRRRFRESNARIKPAAALLVPPLIIYSRPPTPGINAAKNSLSTAGEVGITQREVVSHEGIEPVEEPGRDKFDNLVIGNVLHPERAYDRQRPDRSTVGGTAQDNAARTGLCSLTGMSPQHNAGRDMPGASRGVFPPGRAVSYRSG